MWMRPALELELWRHVTSYDGLVDKEHSQLCRQPCSKRMFRPVLYLTDTRIVCPSNTARLLCLKQIKTHADTHFLCLIKIIQRRNCILYPSVLHPPAAVCRNMSVTLTDRETVLRFSVSAVMRTVNAAAHSTVNLCVGSCRGQPGPQRQPDNPHPNARWTCVFGP